LAVAVIAELSVVSAIAGSGGWSNIRREMNSPAMCWASAALPPLPAISSLLPARMLAVMARAMARRLAAASASLANASSAARLAAR